MAETSGIIVKCLGGLYTVESPDGIYECKARGVFRARGISPAVGDSVTVSGGVITEIGERRNFIIRPPLANLDQILFVVSTVSPAPNFLILDKFIAIAEYKGIEPVVVITKTDLGDGTAVREVYDAIGIRTAEVDYTDEESVQRVRELLSGKISAFMGNSGAGKSTLLNAVDPSLDLATGEISRKLGRGRHTTRHAELYKLAGGGYIADTPGFSSFDTNRYDIIYKDELADCFCDFREYIGKCRFQNCSHTKENGCAVIEAVNDGKIAKTRHESYLAMYEQAKQLKEWEHKNG